MVGIVGDNISCPGIGNDLLQIENPHRYVYYYQLSGPIQGDNLAMICVGKSCFLLFLNNFPQSVEDSNSRVKQLFQCVLSGTNTYIQIQIDPSTIYIAMYCVKEGTG